jgi:hypothetical protein
MGQTSRDMYPLQGLTQEEIIHQAQRSTDNLKAWMAQLPPFLHLVPASSLIPIFQRQSIVLRLAHARALIQASRPFLLNNFTSHPSRSLPSNQGVERRIHDCINAAHDTVEILVSFNGSGIPFYSSWFTQYVSFCAIAVLYIYSLQQQQNTALIPSDTIFTSTRESQTNVRESSINRESFYLAEHCQRLLAAAAQDSSPGKRYNVLLEELRQEVHRHMQTSDVEPRDTALINNYEHAEQGIPIHDDEIGFIADFEADIFHIFGEWGIPE